jgi:hypothetical protein
MRRRVKCLLMVTLLLSSVAGLQVRADSLLETRYPAGLLRPYVPAVSMETDRRSAPKEWARRNGKSKIDARYGATGIVRCGGAIGTAQLTLRADIITTAAHVLIDTNGQPRKCTFQSAAGGAPVAIDMQSIKSGTRTPMSEPATRDWAVARLARPISGAAPYGLAQPGTKPAGVFMVAAGNKRADGMGAESCKARGMLSASWEGVREFAIDCNAAPGSSGAALTAGRNIVGIYVGYRSSDPARAQAYSATHYNFAITVEGPFRRALLAATH